MNTKTPIQLQVPGTVNAVAIDWYKVNHQEFTQAGQLVNSLKYGAAQRSDAQFAELVRQAASLVAQTVAGITFDAVIPVPSFNARTAQNPFGDRKAPYEVAEAVSTLINTPMLTALIKVTPAMAKNGCLTDDAFVAQGVEGLSSVLLLDDLYGAGTSSALAVRKLREANPSIQVYFLSLTKNKFGGLGKEVQLRPATNLAGSSRNGVRFVRLEFMEAGRMERVCVFEDQPAWDEVQDNLAKNPGGSFVMRVRRSEADGSKMAQWRVVPTEHLGS